MEHNELQDLVKEISLQYFDRPFLHNARFNKRLKTTGGRYLINSHDLELNYRSYVQYGIGELTQIIKHELCHYHLHIQGKGYKHRDSDFKSCLYRTGGSRYARPVSLRKERSYQYQLICQSCGQTYLRKYKIDSKKYRCGRCNGSLMMKKFNRNE